MIDSLAIVIIFTLIAVAVYFRYGLVVALAPAFLPMYQFRLVSFGLPTTILELYLGAVILISILKILTQSKEIKPLLKIFVVKYKIFLLLAGLVIVNALAASFWSGDAVNGLGLWRAYFMEPALFVGLVWFIYWCQQQILRTADKRSPQLKTLTNKNWRIKPDQIIIVFGLLAMISALMSILQYLGVLSSEIPWINESPKRVSGLFDYPNASGLFFAPVLVWFGLVGLFGVKSDDNKTRELDSQSNLVKWFHGRTFSLMVAGSALISIWLAVSEGAIVGALVGILFGLLFSPYRNRSIIFLFLLGLLIGLVPATRERVGHLLSDPSVASRQEIWENTGELIRKQPIEGLGLGAFPEAYLTVRKDPTSELVVYPHNIFLNFWVETGIIGMFLTIGLVGYVMVFGFKYTLHIHRGRDTLQCVSTTQCGSTDECITDWRVSMIKLFTGYAMITIIIHGLVDVPFFKNDLAVMWWATLVLLIY